MLWKASAVELVSIVEAINAAVAVVGADADAGDNMVLACNRPFREMLGISEQSSTGHALRNVVPSELWSDLEWHLNQCRTSQTALELVQAYRGDEASKWWRIAVHPILDDGKTCCRVLLTCLEITERVELEKNLMTANTRLGALIESAYDGIITVDVDGAILLFNKAAQNMFGYQPEEIVGRNLKQLIPRRVRAGHDAHVERFVTSPVKSRHMYERGDIVALHKDGSEFPVEISIGKIEIDGIIEFTATIRDVSERAQLVKELQKRASTDSLTGLYNRRTFEDTAVDMIALARRYHHPLSVLMLDIDHFKNVNDSYGHAAGDIVLKALASVGRATLRATDVLARIGGEEFAILLPETVEDRAQFLAERLRTIISGGRFDFSWQDQKPIPFSVSIGVACLLAGETTIEGALGRADRALYAAKRNGRNKVEVYDSGHSCSAA